MPCPPGLRFCPSRSLTVTQILSSILDGLLLGFVYGLAAMGLSLIWGVMRVINLATGRHHRGDVRPPTCSSSHLGLNPYLAMVVVAGLGPGSSAC